MLRLPSHVRRSLVNCLPVYSLHTHKMSVQLAISSSGSAHLSSSGSGQCVKSRQRCKLPSPQGRFPFTLLKTSALKYHNVPRILNVSLTGRNRKRVSRHCQAPGICVPHQQLEASTKVIGTHTDVFCGTAIIRLLPRYSL